MSLNDLTLRARASRAIGPLLCLVACAPSTAPPSTPAVDDNCDTLDPSVAASCKALVINTQREIFPALHTLTGVALADCYDVIHFEFVADIGPGVGGEAVEDLPHRSGTLHYAVSTFLAGPHVPAPIAVDPHEPQHLLYACAHVPDGVNVQHTFWSVVEGSVSTAGAVAFGDAELGADAQRDFEGAQSTLDQFDTATLDADPATACHEVETFLLTEWALETTATPGDDVRAWADAVRKDTELASLVGQQSDASRSRAEARYSEIVEGLVPTFAWRTTLPDTRTLIAKYCGFFTP